MSSASLTFSNWTIQFFTFSQILPESVAYLLVSGKRSDAELQLNEVYAMNAAWPKLWFRATDSQMEMKSANSQVTRSAESSEKTPIVGSDLETLALDVDITPEDVEERGSLAELFGPLYW